MRRHSGMQEYCAPGNNLLTWLMMVSQTAQVYTLGKRDKGKFSRYVLIDIGKCDSFQLSTASRSPATLPTSSHMTAIVTTPTVCHAGIVIF